MFRNRVTSLFVEERIETTAAKAKELRRIAERLITSAKRNAQSVVAQAVNENDKKVAEASRVAAIRQAVKTVRSREALQKLFNVLSERYITRPGGYTRIIHTRRRLGDAAEMAIIELVTDKAAEPVVESDDVNAVAAEAAVADKAEGTSAE
jgi:large subunit ribosomal protein L17